MPARQIIIPEAVPEVLREGLDRLRERLGVPADFGDDVLAEAEQAASRTVLPDADLTAVPFVTIDPPGATDLDQAIHIERDGDGFRVRYAIADVAAFVKPGGAIDAEAHRRGLTLYAPTRRTPLHPPVLSEGAASLLPGQIRPALVWDLHVAADGTNDTASVARARVRSTAQLDYAGVQADLDTGAASEPLQLLKEVGLLRESQERARGGVSLPIPEQEIRAEGEHWELEFRQALPVEGWNAQISLMTGMAAARLMAEGGIGILRTLPPADERSIERLRRVAQGLHISWKKDVGYGEFVRGLDAAVPAHAAMLNACTLLFRGASYSSFTGDLPAEPEHAALATTYAHTTAPLRRLVDRYSGEICVAVSAGQPVPGWVAEALEGLPETMNESDRRAKAYERGIVDLTEALVLSPHLHQRFTGTVIDIDERRRDEGKLQLREPAVEAPITHGHLTLGEEVEADLVTADVLEGVVEFRPSR